MTKEPDDISEHDYVRQLMEDFGLEQSDTIADLLKCLKDEEQEDEANA